jgi:hypothetical protein
MYWESGVQVNDIPTVRSATMPCGGANGSGPGCGGPRRYTIGEMTKLRLMVINRAGGVELGFPSLIFSFCECRNLLIVYNMGDIFFY